MVPVKCTTALSVENVVTPLHPLHVVKLGPVFSFTKEKSAYQY